MILAKLYPRTGSRQLRRSAFSRLPVLALAALLAPALCLTCRGLAAPAANASENRADLSGRDPLAAQASVCTATAVAGHGLSQIGSIKFHADLGADIGGDSAGQLHIHEENMTPESFTPGRLKLELFSEKNGRFKMGSPEAQATSESGSFVILDDNGWLRQVVVPDSVVDIVVEGPHAYSISFYYQRQVESIDPHSGLRVFTGEPFVRFTIAAGAGLNELVLGEERGGKRGVKTFRQDGDKWTLTVPGDGERQRVIHSKEGDLKVKTTEFMAPDGTVISRKVEKRRQFSFGEKIVETIEGIGESAEVTITDYYDDKAKDGDAFGSEKSIRRSFGGWETREFLSDYNNRKQVRQFLNSPFGSPEEMNEVFEKVFEYIGDLDGDGRAEVLETEITRQLGEEVKRTYRLSYSDDKQRWKQGLSVVAAKPGAAWDDPDNLVKAWYYTKDDGTGQRDMITIEQDGTARREKRVRRADGGSESISLRGRMLPDGEIVGTRRVVVSDAMGRETETLEYEDGLLVSSEGTIERDELGRPTLVRYLDGTEERSSYGPYGLRQSTSRSGLVTTYDYNAEGRRVRVNRGGAVEAYDYDSEGRQVRTTREGADGLRRVLYEVSYDEGGNVVGEQSRWGGAEKATHRITAEGKQSIFTNTTNGSTRIETFYLDGRRASVSGTGVAPMKWRYGVSPGGLSWEQEISVGDNGEELEWVKTYQNMLGQEVRVEYSDGSAKTIRYNKKGQLVARTDEDGVSTLYAYNQRGQREVEAIDINRNGVIDYRGEDRIVRTVNSVVKEGDSVVRVSETLVMDEPGNGSWRSIRSERVDLASGKRRFSDESGLTVIETQRDGATLTETITRADGARTVSTTFQDRPVNWVELAPDGTETRRAEVTYDSMGNMTSRSDGKQKMTWTYTPDGQPQSVTTALFDGSTTARTTQYQYDGQGNEVAVTAADGSKLYTEYDPNGKPRRIWGDKTPAIEYTYDSQKRIKTVKIWKGTDKDSGYTTITREYDPLRGRLIRETTDGKHAVIYSWTPAGRKLSRTWARGVVTLYGYNPAGELADIRYSDGTPSVVYTHDRRGRLQTIADGSGEVTLKWEKGCIVGETYGPGGLLAGKSLTRSFDRGQRLVKLEASDGYRVQYGYDKRLRLNSVRTQAERARLLYDTVDGQTDVVEIGSGGALRFRQNFAFDARERLRVAEIFADGKLYASREYTWAAEHAEPLSILSEDGQKWVYSYDDKARLTQAQKLAAAGTDVLPGYDFRYRYSAAGQRTQTVINGAVSHYESDGFGLYTQRDYPGLIGVYGAAQPQDTVLVNAVPALRSGADYYAAVSVDNASAARSATIQVSTALPGASAPQPQVFSFATTQQAVPYIVPRTPESFTYDADGNLLSDGRWHYHWDGENRLIRMESALPAGVLSRALRMDYDSRDRRIRVAELSAQSVPEQWQELSSKLFLYDGNNLIVEQTAFAGSTHLRQYIWEAPLVAGARQPGMTNRLLWARDGQRAYAAASDGRRNIIAWVDLTGGSVAGMREYDPFGRTLRATGVAANSEATPQGSLPFGFRTLYQDRLSGFYQICADYYAPGLGQWLARGKEPMRH